MKVTETNIEGCFIIEQDVYHDHRGYFLESYNQEKFNKIIGKKINFVQDNESFSRKGTLRGLHYQIGSYAQAKLVRAVNGSILDVAVDLRENSSTFGHYIAIELSSENKKQLFIPRGFAHGYIALSEKTIFSYKCDNFYNKEFERGIIFNDPTLNIDWQLPPEEFIISDKDLLLPKLVNARI